MRSMKVLAVSLALFALGFQAFSQEAEETDGFAPPDAGQSAPISTEGFLEGPAYKYFDTGDNLFGIQVGPGFAMHFTTFADGLTVPGWDKLYPATAFAISYQGFLSPSFAIGGKIGGYLASSVDEKSFFAVPLTFVGTFMLSSIPFEFPLGFEVGAIYSKLGAASKIDPILKLRAGVNYRVNSAWSFGVEASYWLVPQLYLEHAEYNSLGGFLEIAALASYHF